MQSEHLADKLQFDAVNDFAKWLSYHWFFSLFKLHFNKKINFKLNLKNILIFTTLNQIIEL